MKTPKCLMKWQSVVALQQGKTCQNGIDKSWDCSWQQSSSRVVLSVNVKGALEGQICCTNKDASRCWSQAAPVAFYLDEWWAGSISPWRVAKKPLTLKVSRRPLPGETLNQSTSRAHSLCTPEKHFRPAFDTVYMFTLLIVYNWSFLMLGWPKTHNDPELESSRRRHCWRIKIIPSFLHKDQPTKVWRVQNFEQLRGNHWMWVFRKSARGHMLTTRLFCDTNRVYGETLKVIKARSRIWKSQEIWNEVWRGKTWRSKPEEANLNKRILKKQNLKKQNPETKSKESLSSMAEPDPFFFFFLFHHFVPFISHFLGPGPELFNLQRIDVTPVTLMIAAPSSEKGDTWQGGSHLGHAACCSFAG